MAYLPLFNPDLIQRTRSLEMLCCMIFDVAQQFAILGYLHTATELISLVNEYHPCFIRFWRKKYNQPLWVAWHMTSIWPSGEFENVDTPVDELSESYASELWRKTKIPEELQNYDERALMKLMETLKDLDDGKMKTSLHPTGYPVTNDAPAVIVKALEVASVLKDEGGAGREGIPNVDDILALIVPRLHEGGMVPYLVQSSRSWKVLKDGALAKSVGVKDEKMKDLSLTVIATFKERFEQGPQRPFQNKSIQELVNIISKNTVEKVRSTEYWNEEESFLPREPLPASEISALEARLNVKLPDDYKEFLSCTNGMPRSWAGLILDPQLHKAEEVKWMGQGDDDYVELQMELLDLQIFYIDRELDYDSWPILDPVLEIGTEDIFSVYLLPPDRVKATQQAYSQWAEKTSDEKVKTSLRSAKKSLAGSVDEFENLDWCVATWDANPEPIEAFSSFRAFLEFKAEESAEDYEDGRRRGLPEYTFLPFSCR